MFEESEDKKAKHLRLLNEISTHLQSLLDSDNFYQEIVEIIQSRFNYYVIQIWSVGKTGAVTLRAQAGAYDQHLEIGHRIPAPVKGITGVVIQERRSYLANDVSADSHYTNLSLPVKSRSQLCVPIVREDEALATLNIESDQLGAFDEDDMITSEAIASQVGVAITNRRLYNKTKDFNEKLRLAVNEKTIELREAHKRILEQQKLLQKENKALKTLVNQEHKTHEIIGNSQAVGAILSMVDKIAPTLATVLIQGESGTGKELIARRLHFKSDRSSKPYVTVNCGALQETLLESELFGHEKGSFTGAVSQKIGLVETADGGTLFLDEIAEISLPIQAKLLRFLQEGEFYRIGGKRSLKVNVRIVSATNRDLELEVREGRFREDLFYRLNTITLRMPPLRKRVEDLPLLVDYFLKNSRFGGSAQEIRRIDPQVYDVFKNYHWPGNIRELQNTVERLKILAEDHAIRIEDIPPNIRLPKNRPEGTEFGVNLPLEEVEKKHILRALSFNHGNKTKTAQSLGITIKTLYNKLHRYGVIQNPQSSVTRPGSPGQTGPHGQPGPGMTRLPSAGDGQKFQRKDFEIERNIEQRE